MKTIIVPIDFSNESLTGLDLALTLAGKSGAGIQMVHVLTGTKDLPHGVLETKRLEAKINFEDILQEYKTKMDKKISLSYIIKEGKVHKEVDNQAGSFEDSVIVLSTHGRSGFEELFIGGNAYKIVSTSRKPVFSVRNCRNIVKINKIVLPLDITFQTREKVSYTAKIAKMFNSEIHIVTLASTKSKSIVKKLDNYSEQVGLFLKKHEIPFKVEHLHGSNLTDITLDYARSINADLISIMTEQEKNVASLLLGNYAHQMINKAVIPVMSFPTYHIGVILDDLRTQGIYIYDM